MKNGSTSEQLKVQKQDILSSEKKIEINQDSNQENKFSINLENRRIGSLAFNIEICIDTQWDSFSLLNQANDQTFSTCISSISSRADFLSDFEELTQKNYKDEESIYLLRKDC